jgi:hypothetical protein
VAGQQVFAAGSTPLDGHGPGRVGAHVGAALLLGHGHAQGDGRLLGSGDGARVVGRGAQARLPLGGEFRLVAQDRHRGQGHGERAADTAFGLHQHEHQGAARDMGAGPGFVPGQGVQFVRHAEGHELVPGRVELDLVDPVAEAVVALEHGQVSVGQVAQLHDPGAAGLGAERLEPGFGPIGALAPGRFPQANVGLEEVDVDQRRRLVLDFMGALDRGG